MLGLMRIMDSTDDEIRTLVGTARDAGIDFFDHADIYGGRMHACEERFAQAMRLSPAERAEIVRRRLDFDRDPQAFRARWQAAQDELDRKSVV